uniref:Protein kinase domain-containing protein n=1 Tax=Periophthalmus magnuspinnatus TaxID=409849 RepID=A0A3B4A4Q7_9GOBI
MILPNLTINNRRALLAGLTAAKKIVICRWKSLQPLTVKGWLLSYREIIQLECSAARMHGAKAKNIFCWSDLLMASSTQKEIDLTVDSMISGDFGSFQIKEIKGEGVCGLVARCIDLSTNKDVAVKISKSHLSVTRHEAKLLRDLRHVSKDKNIVEFITSFMYQGHYCLVMEHLDQSLFDLMISRRCKPLHISHICYITEQLLVTFKELAKRKLIHGDLKPDNIMLVNHKLEPFKIKLIDFGLSTTVRSVLPGYVFQPIGYRAPEVTLGATFNQAIDMWGLGCVLAFLYMSQNLFPIDCEYEMMRIITQIKGMPHVQQLKEGLFTNRYFTKRCDRYELSEKKKTMQFFDLLNQLLHVNPAKRITPEKALKHPFITQKAHTQKTFCCCVTPNKDKNTSSGSNSKEKILVGNIRPAGKCWPFANFFWPARGFWTFFRH